MKKDKPRPRRIKSSSGPADISFILNGRKVRVKSLPERTLLEVLREDLRLTGTKEGCGKGECGACTVIMDDVTVNSCLVPVSQAEGRSVVTIEGLSRDGRVHPIQQAFADHGAVQCGFCIPGMVLSAKVLLDSDPAPSEQAIREGISGNLCRCTGYSKIISAVKEASGKMRKRKR